MNISFSNINFIARLKKKLFPFYKNREIKKIFKILEANESNQIKIAMFVGGCVRKFLNNQTIDDIDIATILTPEEIKKKFENTKVKIVDTGIEHGSVTLLYKNLKLEITTLRQDIKTDGRHADVSYTSSWEEDSSRRDFTINSIYMDRKGKIFDPQSGVEDLKNSIVKFIGDPNRRIEEDYLRIIRYLRFALTYESVIEKNTINAIRLNLNGIKNISKERILNELTKILKLKNFFNINNYIELKNIFLLIFPEFKYLIRLEKKQLLSLDSLSKEMILAILLIDDTNNQEYFFHKYNTSNYTKNTINKLYQIFKLYKSNKNFFTKDLKKNIYFFGKTNIRYLNTLIFFINERVNKTEFDKVSKNIELTEELIFPYKGEYLISKGFTEGENIGVILKDLEKQWIESNFSLSSKKIDEILNKTKHN